MGNRFLQTVVSTRNIGMYKTSHIMDEQNHFLSFPVFRYRFPTLKCNILEYMGLVSAIKKSKCFLNNTEKDALSFIKRQEKVCQKTYPYIKKPCTEFPAKCTQKWENIFSHNKFNWPLIFSLAFKSTSCTKLQNFQFKFLHPIVSTTYNYLNLSTLIRRCALSATQLRKRSFIFSMNAREQNRSGISSVASSREK